DGTARLQPVYGMRTNVHSYAKRDLRAGEKLDGMGGFNSYGLIENLSENAGSPGLPILLNDNLTLKRDIRKDGRICLSDVEYNAQDESFQLYFEALGNKAGALTTNPENTNLQYA
ncbi:MAG: hypothetical protein M3Y60_12620, partial [Bacteroidota bacterium]|nr:hypothetical protein [Bacteroidota bacterium]